MLTCCYCSHCSGWSGTETVTVGSSAHEHRGSPCAARMGGAMRPAVNCRGRAAKIKHWHWHTAVGVEVRCYQRSQFVSRILQKDSWTLFAMSNISGFIEGNPDLRFIWNFIHAGNFGTQNSQYVMCMFAHFSYFHAILVSSWHWKSYWSNCEFTNKGS